MYKNWLKALLEKYADNTASKEEVKEMFELIKHVRNPRELRDVIAETKTAKNWKTQLSQETSTGCGTIYSRSITNPEKV